MNDDALRYYTLDEAVAFAQSLTPEAEDVEEVYMRDWMYQGLRQLGTSKDSVKSCTIEVHDLGIAKPQDYYLAKDLVLHTNGGGEVDYIFRSGARRIHNDVRSTPKFVEVSETKDFFHLSSDANNFPVTKATLEYYSLPSTSEGDLYIPENYVYALSHFIKYMIAFRNNDRMLLDRLRSYWEKEAARIRSKNALPTELEFKEGIARTYMSMITKPTRDRY